uniref:Uncharacterized protein n=1 Tax=Anguilla anguilla TaxID=7936 RepID=A0A0E9SBP9_ANGAN
MIHTAQKTLQMSSVWKVFLVQILILTYTSGFTRAKSPTNVLSVGSIFVQNVL